MMMMIMIIIIIIIFEPASADEPEGLPPVHHDTGQGNMKIYPDPVVQKTWHGGKCPTGTPPHFLIGNIGK